MNETLASILHNGLYEASDETHFSWSRCPVCDDLAGERYDVTGFTDSDHARANDPIEFTCCPKCLHEAAYGEGSYK